MVLIELKRSKFITVDNLKTSFLTQRWGGEHGAAISTSRASNAHVPYGSLAPTGSPDFRASYNNG